jgi:hypothetical protein
MVFGNNALDTLKWSPDKRITLGTGPVAASGGQALCFVRGASPNLFARCIEYKHEYHGRRWPFGTGMALT